MGRVGSIVKARQRRKWLGVAALEYHGFLCDVCQHQAIDSGEDWFDAWCEHPSESVSTDSLMDDMKNGQDAYFADCKGFEPRRPWKDVAAEMGINEGRAEGAYKTAIKDHIAEIKAREAATQAEWEKQCAELQAASRVPS